MKATFEDITSSVIPVVVDFYATWCSPCNLQAPILKELSQEMGAAARVIKIDVDKNPSIAAKYQIRGVPTIMIFKDGSLQWRASGVQTKSQIISELKKLM